MNRIRLGTGSLLILMSASGTTGGYEVPTHAALTNAAFGRSSIDAREAMWRALTLRDKNMSPNIGVAGIADGEPLRKAYWATTFRALGDLVHMIQDMGQVTWIAVPESTTCINEAHHRQPRADLPGDLRAIHNLEMPPVNWLEFSGHFDRQFSAR